MDERNVQHISEEQLTLHYYGDAENAGAVDAHLGECPACRRSFETLKSVLASVEASAEMNAPPRGEEYGAELWRRIEPKLEAPWPRRWRLFGGAGIFPQRWAAGLAMAALLMAAFLLGRITHAPDPPQPAASAEVVRERILLVAVGDHLERSQMLLVELSNAPRNGAVDISSEQRAARDLADANRLYRLTAASTGETALSSVLEELERSLIEIANSPQSISSLELGHLQKRLEAQGILFKVRVLNSQVQERARPAPPAEAGKSRL
jgi:hypothetical protein